MYVWQLTSSTLSGAVANPLPTLAKFKILLSNSMSRPLVAKYPGIPSVGDIAIPKLNDLPGNIYVYIYIYNPLFHKQ